MYESLTIEGFRRFKEVRLSSLNRVNLITGKNNSGKTAVLEALFLLAGRRNPVLPNVVEAMRGRERFAISARSAWGLLFRNLNVEEEISISGRIGGGGTHSLTMRLVREGGLAPQLPLPTEGYSTTKLGPPSTLLYEFADGETGSRTAKAYFEKGTLKFDSPEQTDKPGALYLSPWSRPDKGTAERYTRADAIGLIPEVLGAVRKIDARIERLSLGYENELPLLSAEVKGVELMPTTHVGAGVTRLLDIVLGLLDAENALLLIDEVENAFHHSVMKEIWGVVGELSAEKTTQVVATTHSWECIKSAFEAFRANEDAGLAVHRIDWVGDEAKVTAYNMTELKTVVESDSDIRGW